MLLEFEINTKPVPQARPRFYVKCKRCKYRQLRHTGICDRCNNQVGAYDPKRSKTFKEVVGWHAKLIALEKGIKEPVRDPIALKLIFMMGENGKERFHIKRPDLDNLAKAIKDAMKGIIYHDDSQIVEAHLYKIYGGPKILVHVEVLSV
jgi:Holliday junction resolvase RusA-like endonuclease